MMSHRYTAGTILTYFQVDIWIQFFQLGRHAVSLDASQLGQRNTAVFNLIELIL